MVKISQILLIMQDSFGKIYQLDMC